VAQLALRLDTNIEGDFYVDSTCIDCDACRIFAPSVFHDAGGQSAVFHQPSGHEELLAAQKALISCPTSSIGSTVRHEVKPALAALPEPIAEDVYRCGYTSESSFGAISYFIRRDDGNILIDSPRYASQLVQNIAQRGGVRTMLLTHQDDVADHEQYRARFGCERWLHRDDVRSTTSTVEHQPRGIEPVDIGQDVVMIPTPGHTRGHAVFLYRNRFLFTGDHLAWSPRRGHLYAFRDANWYSWSETIRSMERLRDFRFEYVLPGHGRPVHLPFDEMRASLETCIEWMKRRD
jgi:glyoxylase-like metal-dependent hydrolase (beta-lactamase superfamily II)/ferredoxin